MSDTQQQPLEAGGSISPQDLDHATSKVNQIIKNIEKVIFDKRDPIQLVVVALLADGHVLLEDVPGVGKTMLARALAKSVAADFKRIQFTPDLLPSDVTGSNTYNQKTMEFVFRPGPIFANIVLADEINRTSPRTQSALLEAMEERQVTVDGVSYPVPNPFYVIATQNPIEHQGTYDLPEAQLDRFMLKVSIGYPGLEQEVELLEAHRKENPVNTLTSVATPEELVKLRTLARNVFVKPTLRKYIAEITSSSRTHPDVQVGVSVRGTKQLMHAAQAMALSSHRDYLIPDDVQRIAQACLSHRILMRPEARLAGIANASIVEDLLEKTSVPPQ